MGSLRAGKPIFAQAVLGVGGFDLVLEPRINDFAVGITPALTIAAYRIFGEPAHLQGQAEKIGGNIRLGLKIKHHEKMQLCRALLF